MWPGRTRNSIGSARTRSYAAWVTRSGSWQTSSPHSHLTRPSASGGQSSAARAISSLARRPIPSTSAIRSSRSRSPSTSLACAPWPGPTIPLVTPRRRAGPMPTPARSYPRAHVAHLPPADRRGDADRRAVRVRLRPALHPLPAPRRDRAARAGARDDPRHGDDDPGRGPRSPPRPRVRARRRRRRRRPRRVLRDLGGGLASPDAHRARSGQRATVLAQRGDRDVLRVHGRADPGLETVEGGANADGREPPRRSAGEDAPRPDVGRPVPARPDVDAPLGAASRLHIGRARGPTGPRRADRAVAIAVEAQGEPDVAIRADVAHGAGRP